MRTIRTWLLLLTMVAAVPPVLFSAFVLQRLASNQTEAFGRDVIEVARALSLTIDGRIGEQQSALEVLAQSAALRTGDLEAFRAEMMTAGRLLQTSITLSEAGGQELLNTRLAPGAPLPMRTGAPFASEAARTGKSLVSDLFRGATSGKLVMSIEVPVMESGKPTYVLSSTIDPASIQRLLLRQRLPPEWMTSVIDRQGMFIARSREIEERLGKPSAKVFSEGAAANAEGWVRTVSVEGLSNYLGFSRSDLTGWSVGIGVPVRIVWAPLWQALIPLAVAGLLLAGASMLLALRIARRIQRPIVAVSRLAADEDATADAAPDLGLREANEVARALLLTRAEERAAARSLLASEARYRALAEAQPSIMFVTDAEGRNTYTNRAFQDFAGLSAKALLDRGWLAVIHPEDRRRTAAAWAVSVRDRTPYEIEYRFRRADGAYRWFLGRSVAALDDSGEVTAWFGTATDITDMVAARETLARLGSELEAQVVARTAERDKTWLLSRDLLSVLGPAGRFLSVNPAFTATLGHEEAVFLDTPFIEFVHPDDLQATLAVSEGISRGGAIDRFENRWRHADGSWRTLSWTARAEDGLIYSAARDVTDERATETALRAAEDQARQTQKLEAVGQLTGGVAHDFNNLLQVVSANLELLRPAAVGAGESAARRHAAASDAVRRGAALTRQLLAFARKQPLEPRALDPGRLLREQGELLRRTLGETIDVEVVVAGGVWNVFADPNQLENAILNLAVNARDAIAATGPEATGRLTLEVSNAWLDDRYAAGHADVQAGQYVCLAVSDTGPGMAPDVAARAFEPFFTTKPDGRGTGLGLAQVYGFTKQSGGHVKLYTEPGQGTTVRLYLARAARAADAAEAAGGPAATAQPSVGGSETILVVEDDPEVQTAAVEMLDSLGYRTLRAFDGASALAVMQAGVRIDLVFTDVVMPGPVTSVELSRRAREMQPGAAVLFTSGYTENSIVHHGRLDPGVALLSKPYGRDELARKVRAVLGPPRVPPQPAGEPGHVILLVEDDELIRLSAAMLLESLGHAVVEAGTGAQALAMLESEPGIDILMTDLGLPDINGADLAARARALRPGLAVVAATGRDADGAVPDAVPLQKPYDLKQMRAAIARAAALLGRRARAVGDSSGPARP